MRVYGVMIPDNKKVVYSLCYLRGVGLTTANKICDQLFIDKDMKAKDLTEDACKKIEDFITNNKIVVGDEVKSVSILNIKKLVEIGCFRGQRHKNKLPQRGNSRNNGKSRKRMGERDIMAADNKSLKHIKKTLKHCELHITTTISNTFMALTDDLGNVFFCVSCGKLGIKGSKKNTPFALERLMAETISCLKDTVVKTISVKLKGPSLAGNFISKLDGNSFSVIDIENKTNPPHNGVRLKREKRK